MKTGLYIGRFQPFHKGHTHVIDHMLEEMDEVVIGIGISEDPHKNPYDYSMRLHFFTHLYANTSHMHFFPLIDMSDDRDWVEQILHIPHILASEHITVYAGDLQHDSAIQAIQQEQDMFEGKNLFFREIPRSEVPLSATQIRKKISKQGLQSIEQDIPPEVSELLQKYHPKLDFSKKDIS